MAIIYNPMDAIASSIGQIGEAAAQFVNPFHNLQIAIRNKILENPELGRNLSDLEDASPGTLATLGLGKQLSKAIANIPPSAAEIINRNTRAATEAASKNPTNQNIRASQQVTGMTPLAVQKETLGQQAIQNNPQIAPIVGTQQATGKTPTEILKENLEANDLNSAQQYLQNHPKESIADIARGLLTGDLSVKDASGIFNAGGLSKAVSEAVNAQMHLADIDAMGRLRMALRGDTVNEMMDRIKVSGALSAWRMAGGQGSFKSTYDLLYGDPSVRQHAMELMTDPTKIKTQEDKDLYDTETGIRAMNAGKRLAIQGQLSTRMQTLIDKITKTANNQPEETTDASVTQLNDLLQANAQYGNQLLTAHYGNIPGQHGGFLWLGKGPKKLYFTDVKGNIVSPNRATTPGAVSPKVAKIVNDVMGLYAKDPNQNKFFDSGPGPKLKAAMDSAGTNYDEVKRLIMLKSGALRPQVPVDTDTGDQP